MQMTTDSALEACGAVGDEGLLEREVEGDATHGDPVDHGFGRKGITILQPVGEVSQHSAREEAIAKRRCEARSTGGTDRHNDGTDRRPHGDGRRGGKAEQDVPVGNEAQAKTAEGDGAGDQRVPGGGKRVGQVVYRGFTKPVIRA